MSLRSKKTKQTKNTTAVGNLGESIAAQYLQRHGFTVIDCNYRRKWGEIDLIVFKNETIHFIEVKSVTHETKSELEWAVSHETWQPEDLVHNFKQRQLTRIIDTWLQEERYIGNVQIDVAVVRIVSRETYATVKMIENIVLEQ